MNNLTLFPIEDEPEQLALVGFSYEDLDVGTRVIVQEETRHLHELDRREEEAANYYASIIIEKGERLRRVKDSLPSMKFSAWLKKEFNMTRMTAYNYMNVAEKFGDGSCKTVLQLPKKVLYELGTASDTIIQQVETGEIDPTQKAIREAKAAERRAEEAEKKAKEAEKKLEEAEKTKEAKQKELDIKEKELALFKWEKELEVSKYEADQKKLNEDIKSLKDEKEKIEKSKERTIQEDTPATKAKLEQMDKDIKELEAKEKKLKDEKTKMLKDVERELDKNTQQRNRLLAENEKLEKQVQEYLFRDTEQKRKEEVKLRFRQHREAIRMGLNQASTRSISPIDAQQYFDPDDWEELDQTITDLRRWAEECTRLKESVTSQFIDASQATEAPLVFIEVGSHA